MPNQSQTQEVDYHELQMALASEANGQEIDIDLELANSVDNHLEVPGDDFDFVTNEVNINLI